MNNAEQHINDEGSEISIIDIVKFFTRYRKLLLIGTITGCIVAAAATLKFGQYEAVATLVNNSNKASIDFLLLNRLRKDLPILADRILYHDKNDDSYLNVLTGELWWKKNFVPTFSFTKEDSKEIYGVPKELQDEESTKIKNIVVKVTGANKEQALENLSTTTSFIRSGAAYLELKDIVTGYQINLLNSENEFKKNILELEIELTYLNRRLASLEALKAKYPRSADSITNQIIDLKDSSAKYLPISNQLIAVNLDINSLKENIARLNDKKSQLAIMHRFVSQAKPVIERSFDGLSALEEIAKIESSLMKEQKSTDVNNTALLDKINYDLTLISTRYRMGLEQPSFISTSSPKYLKSLAIGLFAGFFFALLGSFFTALWRRYQNAIEAP